MIESPFDSGSLITARTAGDQGREVFAIPGPIGLGHSTGGHKLIQDGAKLVETVEDILSEIGVLTLCRPEAAPVRAPTPPLPPEQRKVLDMLIFCKVWRGGACEWRVSGQERAIHMTQR